MNVPVSREGPTGLKQHGLIAGVLALIVGCTVLYMFVKLGLVEALGDGTFIAVVALPLIAYALIVYSERVSEVSAGGVAVKFAQFAKSEVTARPTSTNAEADIETISFIAKSSSQALRKRREALSPRDKVAMTIQLGREAYYSDRGVHNYLNVLLAQDAEMPVIFVDDADRFVASTMGVKLRDALSDERSDDQQRKFIEAIELGAPQGISMLEDIIAITTTSVKPGTTNSEALEKMVAEDVTVLISVDIADKPTGVVRRDAIMAQMLTTLASE